MPFPVTPLHDLSAAQTGDIEDSLYDFNRRAVGRDDACGLGFVVRDTAGRIIGVAAGYSWAGIAELKQMWVDERHRGCGYARALLDAFIAEASSRNVGRIWVSSHDFQAPGLYEKLGFVRMAELAGWPEGHSNIILCKTLAGDPA